MRKFTWTMVLAMVILMSLVLAACGGQVQEAAKSVAPTVAAAVGKAVEDAAAAVEEAPMEEAMDGEKKIATFIFTQEFDTLNPMYTGMWFVTVTHQLWNVWAWHFDENDEASTGPGHGDPE